MAPGIVLRSIDELNLWEKNYNQGDVDAIARSIERFGFRGALSIGTDDVTMKGNHTLKALRQIKEDGKPLPKGIIAGPVGDWYAACADISDLPYEEQVAYAIADNAIAGMATTDEEALNELLRELVEIRPDLTGDLGAFGVSLPEIVLPDISEFEVGSSQRLRPGGEIDPDGVMKGPTCTCPRCMFEFEVTA
ncbi:hypothetical protein EON81_16895 [bacterium]|nr:MAG: hypothetical protein EON81_16895 [bacterium]